MSNKNLISAHRKLLTEQEEIDLFTNWKKAIDAGDKRRSELLYTQIVLQYTPIIRKLLRGFSGYTNKNISQEELINESLASLSDAAKRFDLSRGFRFATFARSWIRGSLLTYISKNYFITNPCNNVKLKKLFFSMRNIISEESQNDSNFILTAELATRIATEYEVEVEDVLFMNNILKSPQESLNDLINPFGGSDTTTKEDILIDDTADTEDMVIKSHNLEFHKQLITNAVEKLDERERAIFTSQVLQDKEDSKTLEELGASFGISKERVRQIRNSAQEKIQIDIRSQLKTMGIEYQDLF